MTTITLDGESLTIEQLATIARHPSVPVTRDPKTHARVAASEALIGTIVANYRAAWAEGSAAPSEYGVTTGFGEFKDKPIAPDDLVQLQRNLLLSHSVGVGDNSDPDDLTNYYPPEIIRGALATRLNAFLKGYSGVRTKLVEVVEAMLNRGVIPLVPLRGSVGASGDLCPLSHLFAVLLGVGRYYVLAEDPERQNLLPAGEEPAPSGRSESRGGRRPDEGRASTPTLHAASELPAFLGFDAEEIKPSFKEGLALVNGANFSAAMLALAVFDGEALVAAADSAAALTMEALCGCTRALDPKVHEARGQVGQIESAARMRQLLTGSRLVERAGAVQDAYSIRCAPQVHGASRDAIVYAHSVAEREINAATDNPLFFPEDGQPFDMAFRANWPAWYHGDQRLAYSAGNFHGQPLALAADFLTIALAELANISERRTALMLDGNHNRGLPQNLTTRPGVNSGLMIAQYTAASIVSENKVLAHPASVDSIPTGANSEDHVSMSTWAARKLRNVAANVQAVLAIELMVAAQAVEWRVSFDFDPNRRAPKLLTLDEAEQQAKEFAQRVDGQSSRIAQQLGTGTGALYRRIRSLVPPVLHDRPLSDDVRKLRQLVVA